MEHKSLINNGMRYISYLLFLLLLGCDNSALQQELEAAQTTIKQLEQELKEVKTASVEAPLVHLVLFKLKADADPNVMLTELQKLEAISEVKELEIGPYEDLGDPRALSDYSLIMQMSFIDTAAYQTYQKHPIHLALKENIKPILAGPPATYDFIKQ